jgi:hypothetical protein
MGDGDVHLSTRVCTNELVGWFNGRGRYDCWVTWIHCCDMCVEVEARLSSK